MATPKPMCKAFALPGRNGYSLVLAETVGRQEIEVSIQQPETASTHHRVVARVVISGEQFKLLCRMDSAYDGLEVGKPIVDAEYPEVGPIAVLDEERREE